MVNLQNRQSRAQPSFFRRPALQIAVRVRTAGAGGEKTAPTDIHFPAFADAAFTRKCGTLIAALRPLPPDRPLKANLRSEFKQLFCYIRIGKGRSGKFVFGKCRPPTQPTCGFFSYAQCIFKFDAELSSNVVELCVFEQKLNRFDNSSFAASLLYFGPAQRMSAVPVGFSPISASHLRTSRA